MDSQQSYSDDGVNESALPSDVRASADQSVGGVSQAT